MALMAVCPVAPGEHWFQGKLEFMLSQRGKPLLVHDGHTFGIQYVRKDKKYWQCNLSRKFNCKARVTTTDTGEIIVTNNEHCHTEIRQHLRKDYQRNKVMMNALINLSNNRLAVENLKRHNVNNIANNLSNLQTMVAASQAAAAAAAVPLALQAAAATATSTSAHHPHTSAMASNAILDLGKRALLSMEEAAKQPLPAAISTAASALHLHCNNNNNNQIGGGSNEGSFNNQEESGGIVGRENRPEVTHMENNGNQVDDDGDDDTAAAAADTHEQVDMINPDYCRKSTHSSPLHDAAMRLHQDLQQQQQQHYLNHSLDNELPLDCGIRSNVAKRETDTETELAGPSLNKCNEFNTFGSTGAAATSASTSMATTPTALSASMAATTIYNQNWDCKKEESSTSPPSMADQSHFG